MQSGRAHQQHAAHRAGRHAPQHRNLRAHAIADASRPRPAQKRRNVLNADHQAGQRRVIAHAQMHIRRQNRQRQPDRQIADKREVDVPEDVPHFRTRCVRRGIRCDVGGRTFHAEGSEQGGAACSLQYNEAKLPFRVAATNRGAPSRMPPDHRAALRRRLRLRCLFAKCLVEKLHYPLPRVVAVPRLRRRPTEHPDRQRPMILARIRDQLHRHALLPQRAIHLLATAPADRSSRSGPACSMKRRLRLRRPGQRALPPRVLQCSQGLPKYQRSYHEPPSVPYSLNWSITGAPLMMALKRSVFPSTNAAISPP